MAPQVGLEPTTLRLTAECSAIELLRIILFPLSCSFPCPILSSRAFSIPASLSSALLPPVYSITEARMISLHPRSLLVPGNDLLSRAVSSQVPSARGGLTSVFGMGTGGTLQLLSPEIFQRFLSLPSLLSLPLSRFRALRSVRSPPRLQNCTG